MARIMGIDYGEKAVGVALSAPDGAFAFPHGIHTNTDGLVAELAALARVQEVSEIVIGESLNHSGAPNPIHRHALIFAAALGEATGLPVAFAPEAFSTAEARRQFATTEKTRSSKQSPRADASAAAIILEGYLAKRRAAQTHAIVPDMDEPAPDPKISIDEFHKVEMRIGQIVAAERVPDTDKLLKLTVDLGEPEPRQIVSGIAAYFPEPSALVGKRCPFVANLAPRTLRGLTSNGMIVAVSTDEGAFSLLEVPETIPPGTKLK